MCTYEISGGKWHAHRKLITPTFHFQILDIFVEVFVEKSSILMKKLLSKAGGKGFDIYPFITRCALDIICGKFITCDCHKDVNGEIYIILNFNI
jgi:cytochrome P450 family 4